MDDDKTRLESKLCQNIAALSTVFLGVLSGQLTDIPSAVVHVSAARRQIQWLAKKKKKKGTPGTEITQWASGSTAQWSVNSDHSLTVTFHVVSKWSKRSDAIRRYVASSLHALIALILSVFKIVSSLQRSHGAQHLVMYLTLTSTCLRLQSSPGEMLFLSCSDFSVTVASSRQAVRKNCMFAYRLLHPWLLDMQSKQRRCRGRPRRTMQQPRVSVSGAGRKWSPSQT